MNERSTIRVVSLFSGGLDSSLAILLMLKQNVQVHALTFQTDFGCSITGASSAAFDPYPVAEKYGFDVEVRHLGEKFVEIVKNPKHGHGKNLNPCIDCRIMMLNEARQVMQELEAEAIITGEVLGQRPMSQLRNSLNLVEKETGLKGRLVRPLSARLLEPTIPELEGKIDRSRLEAISGRSRKRQMELAKEMGLDDYPTPASGCLLTDPNFTRRLRDLLQHSTIVDNNSLNLLKVGRHFRFSPEVKVIVGRNEDDNNEIERFRRLSDIVFEARDSGSPITILEGRPTADAIDFAARVTARYCDQKRQPSVPITVTYPDREEVIEVAPMDDATLAEKRL